MLINDLSILGDSYSTFEGCMTPKTSLSWYFNIIKDGLTDLCRKEDTWWSQLSQYFGCCLNCNNSYSGSTICNTGYNGADASKFSFISRMNNLGNPDTILIFGGTNDYWADVPLGLFKYFDWNNQDLFSFRPAMAYMLKNIKEKYRDADIHFIINDVINGDFNESIIAICNYYRISYLKLSNIDKMSNHPSVLGMNQIYLQVRQYLIDKQTKPSQ